jgi:hypothetical protein
MKLSEQPTIGADAQVIDSSLGVWTQVGHDVKFYRSSLGDYSYIMQHSQVMHSRIGNFCSIASFVRLNPGNHPLERPTSHHMTYRAAQYGFADSDDTEFFAGCISPYVESLRKCVNDGIRRGAARCAPTAEYGFSTPHEMHPFLHGVKRILSPSVMMFGLVIMSQCCPV